MAPFYISRRPLSRSSSPSSLEDIDEEPEPSSSYTFSHLYLSASGASNGRVQEQHCFGESMGLPLGPSRCVRDGGRGPQEVFQSPYTDKLQKNLNICALISGFFVPTSHRSSYDTLASSHATLLAAMGDAFGKPAQQIAGALTRVPVSAPFRANQENYPDIRFWTQQAYTRALKERKKADHVLQPNQHKPLRGSTRLAESNENVTTDFIELENGVSVDGRTAKAIRSFTHALLVDMRNGHLEMKLPAVWSDTGIHEQKYLLSELYLQYPYVQFCQNDWKAQYLTSRVLTSLHQSHNKKQGKVKREPVEMKIEPLDSDPDIVMLDTAPVVQETQKRKAETTLKAPVPQKPKLIPNSPSPSPSALPVVTAQPPSIAAPPVSQALPPQPPVPIPPASSPPPSIEERTIAAPLPAISPDLAVPPIQPQAPVPLTFVNPLNAVFGPASGPAGRLESLRSLQNTDVGMKAAGITASGDTPKKTSEDHSWKWRRHEGRNEQQKR